MTDEELRSDLWQIWDGWWPQTAQDPDECDRVAALLIALAERLKGRAKDSSAVWAVTVDVERHLSFVVRGVYKQLPGTVWTTRNV